MVKTLGFRNLGFSGKIFKIHSGYNTLIIENMGLKKKQTTAVVCVMYVYYHLFLKIHSFQIHLEFLSIFELLVLLINVCFLKNYF